MKLGDLEALRGVVKFPVRIKCATLAVEHPHAGLGGALRLAEPRDVAELAARPRFLAVEVHEHVRP